MLFSHPQKIVLRLIMCSCYIGIMEKKIGNYNNVGGFYRGYIGIMENQMETTI